MQIGIIGLGRLGLALARGLDRSKKVELIYGFSRDKEKGKTAVRQAGSLSLRDSETEIFELCDIIFLWTKGSDAQEVLERNSGIIGRRLPVIVSCTTGVPLAGYTPRWAECLPNVNMAAGFGATIIHYASNLSESDRQIINDILRLTGTIMKFPVKTCTYILRFRAAARPYTRLCLNCLPIPSAGGMTSALNFAAN